MSAGLDNANWLVIPPTPPEQWWLEPAHTGMPESPELRALQQQLDLEEIGEAKPFSTEETYAYLRLRGLRDLFFFAKFILCFDRLQAECHADMAYAWTCPDGTPLARGLAGLFRWAAFHRGGLKTTLLTIGSALFDLARNRDERILIFSANYTVAQKIFGSIRQLLEGRGEGGRLLLDCFPELRTAKKDREKWAENMLTVPRPTPYTDHSLECSGVNATITGSHFTKEYVDDAVGKLENAEQMTKIFGQYDNLDPLLDSFETGQRRLVGTPWGFWDLIARAERHEPSACIARRSMFEEPDPTAASGRRPVTDPAKFTYDRLIYRWKPNMDRTLAKAKQIARTTPYFFSCQFSCWPKAEGTIGFRAEWFRRFVRRGDILCELGSDGRDVKRVALQSCRVFIILDPIGGDKRGTYGPRDPNQAPTMDSDYVGVAVVAVNEENMRYVVEVKRRRWNDDEFQANVFDLVARYPGASVHIEGTGGQRHIFKGFLDAWKRGRPMFTLGEWSGGKASKSERIRGLIPMIAEGFMLFRAEASPAMQEDTEACIQTLLDGDSAQHDDDADALSAIQQIGFAPGANVEQDRLRQLRELAEDDELSRLDPTSAWAWGVVAKKKRVSSSMFALGSDFNGGGANA